MSTSTQTIEMVTGNRKEFSLDAEALETLEDNCCFMCDWASEVWFNINHANPAESQIRIVEEHDEMEGSNTYNLTVKQLEEAFQPCINSVNSDIAGDLIKFVSTGDAGYLDAVASDCILQFACFSELIYG